VRLSKFRPVNTYFSNMLGFRSHALAENMSLASMSERDFSCRANVFVVDI
jgi:hypothetical protein